MGLLYDQSLAGLVALSVVAQLEAAFFLQDESDPRRGGRSEELAMDKDDSVGTMFPSCRPLYPDPNRLPASRQRYAERHGTHPEVGCDELVLGQDVGDEPILQRDI